MARITHTYAPDAPERALLATPRDDVVREVADGADRWVAESGPFTHYERHLEHHADGTVTQTIDVRTAPLLWGPYRPMLMRTLARRPAPGHKPWWAPPEAVDARAGTAIGALCLLALVLGYLGSLLTQTITFAADDLGASKADQSTTLAAVRVGVLGALALTALADRRGRRQVLIWATTAACFLSVLTAAAPGLVAIGVTQSLVRGLVTACGVLLTIVAAEEMPAGSRAFAISLLSVTGALGVGMVLWALPLADVTDGGWRLVFVVPLVFLPVLRVVARHLPESRRFDAAHVVAPMAGHGGRFWLLAASALLLALFTAPASQLLNEFLRDERGFSAARISLFTLLTNTPGGLGIVIGGRLADTRGRRMVGAIGVAGGVLLTVAMVLASGWPMWALSAAGAVVGAMVVPALGVYGPELFPTSLRGKANGAITILGVTGSVLGLFIAGQLSERWDGLGPALSVLALGPLAMAVLVLLAYPETAHRELEDLNPEDASPPFVPPRPLSPAADPQVD